MKRVIVGSMIPTFVLALGCTSIPGSQAGTSSQTVQEVRAMSEQEQVKLALSAAPPQISDQAGAMVYGPDGTLKEVRPSSNGFTCIPTVMNLPDPDPMCMDAAVRQWMTDVMNNAPKPTNTVPGIAYMARGGSHFEKDGKVVMSGEGAKIVKEPPHWMIMWPFDAAATHLPTVPNPSGVYIMFDGTPYAHLMVYQDPNQMK